MAATVEGKEFFPSSASRLSSLNSTPNLPWEGKGVGGVSQVVPSSAQAPPSASLILGREGG